jgi:hypothetical protein
MKAANFDVGEYKTALIEFGKCRRGIKSHEIYEMLESVKPNQVVPWGLESLLKKYCDTNPTSTWGSCIKPAQRLWQLIYGQKK